ncbi:hypothetical protein CISG_08784 [Coccidioides immitis RMSCC 3703]|uniref:HTH CENPB-type domain-containing protein n=1 Tax=Coccidioides immitis RMSCC 3703 TaxID=454286 RepID=A0A0J8R6R6_COCIT|nr:hypothetical protein CISG_08784 [Coccidioides immitis RMSCC 3703]
MEPNNQNQNKKRYLSSKGEQAGLSVLIQKGKQTRSGSVEVVYSPKIPGGHERGKQCGVQRLEPWTLYEEQENERNPQASERYFFNFLNHPLQHVRMPPIRNKNARSSIEIEGRIELAISTLKKQEISSITEAAWLFNVPYTTLYHQTKERHAQISLHTNSTKLTEPEENQLVQWILDLAKQGISPQPAFVENMANHLLAMQDPTSPPPHVGQN